MTTTLPTRAQIDAAGDIDFETPRPAKRQRGVTIQLVYHGAPVTFTFDANGAPQIHEIEQSIDTLLKREGWSTPQLAQATNGNGKKPASERVAPIYDGDGQPCCPVHKKPLSEGRYGLYCSAKAKDGQAANDKGYCALRFTEQ